MTDYRGEASIGARIRAARRDRGYRTTRELAETLTGTKITESVLENIESGRKADLTLGQFLSIAYALRVPPSYLLAPLVRPSAHLDLQNITDDLQGLSAAEFDAWFSGASTGAHRPSSTAERNDRENLDAYRELFSLLREIDRLNVVAALEGSERDSRDANGDSPALTRIRALQARANELSQLLRTSGFETNA
ncbi:helix-turn-helix domain-containing protein [Agromyces ramosus]|uniref:Transcriptional regulator with XRE-family HTH domain n=1 Tax=Agromyces ramosus TaxID=33879 RepID=A0ABU0RBT3_9MICO|nr:helix-turn-helix domain-containing protein [Agromyces ramosus]MDQ0894489.1 transcriptional regulator with XRE-family HTH domain [Agromyces ramosus]